MPCIESMPRAMKDIQNQIEKISAQDAVSFKSLNICFSSSKSRSGGCL